MAIAEKVAAILREPATVRINFRYAGVRIYGSGYAAVAQAIEREHIAVRLPGSAVAQRLMRSSGVASYSSSENTLYVPSANFLEGNVIHDKALVVHEMTHALMDYHRHNMAVRQSEAVAYLAQMMYVFNHGITSTERLLDFSEGTGGNESDIFIAAWNIAHSILTTRGGYDVAGDSGAGLEAALARHPLYRRRADNETDYAGW
jgi:hypothetical protein